VAGLWAEVGAEGSGGLALPPFWAGCFPQLSSLPHSSVPLRERLASMSSCSEEFTLHLSSKQKNIFFFSSFYYNFCFI